jgi:hypothetical protein
MATVLLLAAMVRAAVVSPMSGFSPELQARLVGEVEGQSQGSGRAQPVAPRRLLIPTFAVITDSGVSSLQWNTGDGSVGEVYVSDNQGPAKLLAAGADGVASMPWLTPEHEYLFQLYGDRERRRILATLRIPPAAGQ